MLVAHPQLELSRASRSLMASASALGPRVVVRDLYALYPDYLIDVAAEQAALGPATLVVWLHPVHWYGMPPLMKLWLDDVLSFGWAYGPDGDGAARQGPVAGGEHRRRRGVVPARQLQPLLLRRLPAALRADRGAVRDALPAADADARRAPRRAATRSTTTPRSSPSGWRATRSGTRSPRSTNARAASSRSPRARPCRRRPNTGRRSRPLRPGGAHGNRLMEHSSWLIDSLIYLGAAVLAVPLARYLGLGSIIGYLGAGIAIGPWGLRFVTNPQDMLHFSEFGVVLMLFLVGLELEPRRLWALRKPIFGWGSVQLFGSAALMVAAALALGIDWPARGRRRARPRAVVDRDRPVGLVRAQPDGDIVGPERAERGLAAGRGGDPDPRPAAVAGGGRAGQRGRGRRRLARRGQGGRRDRRHRARRAPACCARRCAGSRAAARPRSSPPPRCCWWSRPRR